MRKTQYIENMSTWALKKFLLNEEQWGKNQHIEQFHQADWTETIITLLCPSNGMVSEWNSFIIGTIPRYAMILRL